MKAIIIDDEKQAITSLEMELKGVTPPVEIIGTANSVTTGVRLLQQQTPDLLFLDIRLKDGLGFDILSRLDNFGKFRVVFTSAYDQYAIKAFKHGAFDYLLKPIDPDDLRETMSRIAAEMELHNNAIPEQQLDQWGVLSGSMSADPKIPLSTSQGIYLKKIASILYIKADGNYTWFYFEDEKAPMLISRTLKDFEELLAHFGFVRIHFSYLINIHHLRSFHTKEGNYVMMSDGCSLTVSARKKTNLLDILRKKS